MKLESNLLLVWVALAASIDHKIFPQVYAVGTQPDNEKNQAVLPLLPNPNDSRYLSGPLEIEEGGEEGEPPHARNLRHYKRDKSYDIYSDNAMTVADIDEQQLSSSRTGTREFGTLAPIREGRRPLLFIVAPEEPSSQPSTSPATESPSSSPTLSLNPTVPKRAPPKPSRSCPDVDALSIVNTSAILYLLGDPSLINDQEMREALATGFMQTYNTLNEGSNRRCDGFSRRIVNVTVDPTQTSPRRRALQEQNTSSIFQKFLSNERFTVFFGVSFECRGGCSENTTLFEDSLALLPDGSMPCQECFFNSAVIFGGVSYFVFRDFYFSFVQASSAFRGGFIAEIEEVWEVFPVECSAQGFARNDTVLVPISKRTAGVLQGNDTTLQSVVETTFVRNFNRASQVEEECDDFIRVAESAVFTGDIRGRRHLMAPRDPTGRKFQRLTAILRMKFKCQRTCPDDVKLFGNDGCRRQRAMMSFSQSEEEDTSQRRTARKLEDIGQVDLCFCPLIILPPPAPTFAPTAAPSVLPSASPAPSGPTLSPGPSITAEPSTLAPTKFQKAPPTVGPVEAATLSGFTDTLAALGL